MAALERLGTRMHVYEFGRHGWEKDESKRRGGSDLWNYERFEVPQFHFDTPDECAIAAL